MKKKKKKERKIKGVKRLVLILGIIFGAIAVLYIFQNVPTLIARGYVRKLAAEYRSSITEHIAPTIEYTDLNNNQGYYTFTTDEEFEILNITDIHIGGGIFTLKRDLKTIYEVMTMVKEEDPDLVILDGDNTFCVPGPIFNGGGTFNNRQAARTVNLMFEELGVYYTLVFGNHDTEAFDYYNREYMGNLYSGKIKTSDSFEHCIFRSEFTDKGLYDRYSVTNQVLVVRNSSNEIKKVITLLDSNDYIDGSLSSTINWYYDTIHDEQVMWAKEQIEALRTLSGNDSLQSLYFFHIPVSEFYIAYQEYANNTLEHTEYVSGEWGEIPVSVTDKAGETRDINIWFGGVTSDKGLAEKDIFFETLGPSELGGIGAIEAVFCGHDHTNYGVLKYYGVTLSYGYSLDNIAYRSSGKDIATCGIQRGATRIVINNGVVTMEHKNAYTDYHCSTTKFFNVDPTKRYYTLDE